MCGRLADQLRPLGQRQWIITINSDTFMVLIVAVVVAFSLFARTLRECSTIHSLPELFFFFSFFNVEISSRTLI